MKRGLLWGFIFLLVIFPLVSAQTEIDYFYSTGCSHCAKVADSGVLEEVAKLDDVSLEKHNLFASQENRDLFDYYVGELNPPTKGWPLAVINCEGKYSYLLGDVPIIENLEERAKRCEGDSISGDVTKDNVKKLTLWSIIVAALIDSVNPCAFGVLIFLMATLLKMGSSKRALRAGLIYSGIIFVTYLLVGLLLYNVIDRIASTAYFYYFYLGVAALILLLGFLQLKDVFWYGKGLTLRIPTSAKPIIQNLMAKGTLISLILLGILVALFELPCTGEVYIGILTVMSLHKTFGIGYLVLYNLIFVLPLVILTYLVYKGTSTERLTEWTSNNKRYMKLISGLLLIGLATYIFITAVKFV